MDRRIGPDNGDRGLGTSLRAQLAIGTWFHGAQGNGSTAQALS